MWLQEAIGRAVGAEPGQGECGVKACSRTRAGTGVGCVGGSGGHKALARSHYRIIYRPTGLGGGRALGAG